MNSKEILEQALKLKPDEIYRCGRAFAKSLDEPDATLDGIWVEEAEQRLAAYREGKLAAGPMEEREQ
jgi:Putative addiction module component